MKSVNWHDGQKLGPDDLNCQNIFMQQGLMEIMSSLFGQTTAILDLKIDLEYLTSDILKVTNLVGIISGQIVTYPYLNKDSLVYSADQINLKDIDQHQVAIYARVDDKSVNKFYHIAKVPFRVPRLKLSTNKMNEDDTVLCYLERDEYAKWSVTSDYIPYSVKYQGLYKQLLENNLHTFIKELMAYINEQKLYVQDSIGIDLLSSLDILLDILFYQLSDQYKQPIFIQNFIRDLIQIYKIFERFHREKIQGVPFVIGSIEPISQTLKNFKKSIRSFMLEGRKDERIAFHSEGDILCAKFDLDKDSKKRHRYYLFIMKPYVDYTYNPKIIRLAAPSRIPILRGLSIPGIKLLHKSYNPTTITVETQYYDIFEITHSRELDYVCSEGYIACDHDALHKELRVFLVKSYIDAY